MEILDIIKAVKENKQVEDFLYKNGEAYLAHLFAMFDEANKNEYQVGFFSPEDNRIHVFLYDSELNTCIKNAGEEPFKEPDSEINELNVNNIKVDIKDALNKAIDETKKMKEIITKKILVVQNLDGIDLYNFTFVTVSMKTINIKLDASTGELISSDVFSLMDMAKGKKIFTKENHK
jgi:hypothetical protein